MPSSAPKPSCFSDKDWKDYAASLPEDRRGKYYNVFTECTRNFQQIALKQGICDNPTAFTTKQAHFVLRPTVKE